MMVEKAKMYLNENTKWLLIIVGALSSVIFAWATMGNRVGNVEDRTTKAEKAIEVHCEDNKRTHEKVSQEFRDIKENQMEQRIITKEIVTKQDRVIEDLEKLGTKIDAK
jgi:hypothetical protein